MHTLPPPLVASINEIRAAASRAEQVRALLGDREIPGSPNQSDLAPDPFVGEGWFPPLSRFYTAPASNKEQNTTLITKNGYLSSISGISLPEALISNPDFALSPSSNRHSESGISLARSDRIRRIPNPSGLALARQYPKYISRLRATRWPPATAHCIHAQFLPHGQYGSRR